MKVEFGGFLTAKLTGLRRCVAENGLYYTWHHFVGKIGRHVSRLPGFGCLSRLLLTYAHELRLFVPNEGVTGEIVFPAGAKALDWTSPALPPAPRRVALFAVFSSDGHIPETTHYYLRGLRQVTDAIICVGDCPLFTSELEKLKSEVEVARFRRHGEYDFGSYRRAYRLAEEFGLLAGRPEVIFANDSCYGPVFPLNEAFAAMAARHLDFWGMTANLHAGLMHIQSYFYSFGPRVVADGALRNFLMASEGLTSRKEIIEYAEKRFSRELEKQGFTWATYIDYRQLRNNPTTFPVRLLKRRCPLIKTKAIGGESHESISCALKMIEAANPELYAAIAASIRH